jgi:hypothetical protein
MIKFKIGENKLKNCPLLYEGIFNFLRIKNLDVFILRVFLEFLQFILNKLSLLFFLKN